VYSPYYPPHDGRVTRIKERCVNNAVGWTASGGVGVSGSQRCKAKVDLLSAPPSTAPEVAVQVEHRLNVTRSRKSDRENGYENRLPVFSNERSPMDWLQSSVGPAQSRIRNWISSNSILNWTFLYLSKSINNKVKLVIHMLCIFIC